MEGWLTPPPDQPIPADETNPAPAEPIAVAQAAVAQGAADE
jgi:hypothetical protein